MRELISCARAINVVTNGLTIAALLGRHEPSSISVTLAGGTYRPDLGAFVGPRAEAIVSSCWADRAIITTTLDARGEPIFDDPYDARIKQIMRDHARDTQTLRVVSGH